MRYLIVGCGRVGSMLAKRLSKAGHRGAAVGPEHDARLGVVEANQRLALGDGIAVLDEDLRDDAALEMLDGLAIALDRDRARCQRGALQGRRRGLQPDRWLIYGGAMFHDIELTQRYRTSSLRFEVDSANAAREQGCT